MVFKEFMKVWRKDNLLQQAIDDMHRMLDLAERMYNAAMQEAFYQGGSDIDIKATDQAINRFERKIRKKVLEHLTINPKQDVTSSLCLTSIIIDIERIGDHCKNIIETAELKNDESVERYQKVIADFDQATKKAFGLTMAALKNGDAKLAKQVMENHGKMKRAVTKMIRDIVKDDISVKASTYYILLAKEVKKVHAHLSIVCSSVANPFPRIGFKS
ncbi:MAG: hypothetical protein KJ709_09670 [Nanoarchaeota archaeon]|nr:hypothetical protein [Nanoarchaeota archaeon]